MSKNLDIARSYTDSEINTSLGLKAPLASPTFTGTVTAPTFTGNVTGNAATATSFTTVVGIAPSYACRAWVNFNGTGTVAIRASGNVSSITDNGTGDYTVNFITAMVDANYAIIGAAKDDTDDAAAITWNRRATTTNTTTQSRFVTAHIGTQYDCPQVDVAIFR